MTTQFKVPDFKARIYKIKKDKAKNLPGFEKVDRAGRKDEKLSLPIKGLDDWFEENEEQMQVVKDLTPGDPMPSP